MLIVMASPAAAQIRLFQDGQIIKIGPTKAERRARQMGVMMGAMSGRQSAPDAKTQNKAPPSSSQGIPNQGIIRQVDRAR
jgi:hypothetical protein